MARSRRQTPPPKRMNALRSFLQVDKLEDRLAPDNGLWAAVFRGPFGMGPQADADQLTTLFAENGVTSDEVSVIRSLDNSGAFALQTPLEVTEAELSAQISTIPGFVFFQPITIPKGTFTTGVDRTFFRGFVDVPDFIKRDGQGLIPPNGGLVDPGPADVLTNNNAGSTGTANFTQSETTVLAFGSTVLIGYNDSGSFTGGANRFTGFSRSTDGGTTFTDGGSLPVNAGGDAGDPVMARDNTTGRIYFSTLGFSVSTIQMFRSDDGGATWLPPVNATPGGSSEDKQWHTVDNFAGAGNGNVYLVSRRFGAGPGIYFFRSTDGGATFGPTGGTLITSGAQGAYITVAPDHSIQAYWYAGTSILMRRSTDFGATFGAPITVASGLVGGVNGDLALTGLRQGTATFSGFRSNEFPHATVNPTNGHMYVTYANNPAGTDKADTFFVMSTDGGTTWSAPLRVNDDVTTTDQWQPTLAVTPDGSRLGIFYYSRQEDTLNNNLFKYYGRIATISGATVSFAPSFAVSSVSSLPEFGRDSVVNSVYMGDYDTTYATNDAFHVVWADNRDDLPGGAGRKDPNVYYQKIALGFAVTGTNPAVGSTVSVAPTIFTVNFSDPYDVISVVASDFSVNGIPATGVVFVDGDTVNFTYGASPVTAQGLQTMAVAAGAITSAGDPIIAFSGQFRFDALLLQVIATTPPVGGTFTLPAPFTYDVTFNEAVDPLSVQIGDLALAGIAGATVTGVTVLPGNTTARFTLSMPNIEGALTASIGAGLVNDAFGNPGAAFSGVYQVDIGTVPYPVPLIAKNPIGSRAYDPSIGGVINFAGDVDNFTILLDANQKISIIVRPTTATLQPRVELFNAANVSMGFAAAGAPGLVTGLQTRDIVAAGMYRIAITGVGGSLGGYSVQVILNAAFELEGLIPGNNNTTATAQNIDGSFRTETTSYNTGSIGNVLGTTDNAGYAATAIPFAFEDISGTGTVIAALTGVDDTATTITPGFTFPFFGTNFTSFGVSSNGLIMFAGTDGTFTNSDLTTSPTLASIAPFWDDLHTAGGAAGSNVFFQVSGVGANQHLTIQWNNIRFFSGGAAGDTLTFEALLFADGRIQFNYLDIVSGAAAGNNGASATVGIKAAGAQGVNRLLLAFNNGPNAFVGNGQSTLITPPSPTPDLYSLTLVAGQKVTVGIAATAPVAGALLVELLNSGGGVIATGVGGSANLASVISNFTAPPGGTFYIRVTGGTNIPYDVVVTKDAGFDTEDNNTAGTAQNVTGTTGAFGAITPSAVYLAAAITPAFENISGTGTIIAGLTGVDDVSVSIPIGFTFPFFGTNQTTVFVSSNGLLTFGGADGTFTNGDLTTTPALAAIAPFWDDLHTAGGLAGSNVFFQVSGAGPSLHLTVQWNQIRFFSGGTAGDTLTFEAQLYADGRIQFNYLDLVSGTAAGNNGASATVGIKAAGTQGPNRLLLAFNNGPNTFVGTGKSTLISQPPGDDWYAVTLAPNQTALQVETSTPGDGPGEFVNTLNPKVDVFDSTGTTLIASGVALGDGRNELALITGLTPGLSYRVKISGEGGSVGEYFATITALRTPTVTSKVDDGLPSTFGPDGSFTVPNAAANGWTNVTGAGYLNDYTVHAVGGPSAANNFAFWSVRVTSTTPELFATWVPRPTNATNATYQVYLGATLIGTVVVNQQISPNDALMGTTPLKSLGSYVVPVGTTFLSVRLLTLGANGDVVADGVFDPPSDSLTMIDVTHLSAPVNAGSVTVVAPTRRMSSVAQDLFGTQSTALRPSQLVATGRAVRPPVLADGDLAASIAPIEVSAVTIAPPMADAVPTDEIWVGFEADLIDVR